MSKLEELTELQQHIDRVLKVLNDEEQREFTRQGYTHAPDYWYAEDRAKYVALDCGGSGAFLVEKSTGELYNIKGYGQADKNKKRKADIGNVFTVDAVALHKKRWNYLK